MIEMRNDVMRRATFDTATKEAAKDNFNYAMHQTMEERLSSFHAKQIKPKRKIPWFTIITVVTTIPFFMNGSISSLSSMANSSSSQESQHINEVISGMQAVAPDENAIVSIQIGDRIVQREVSIDDLKALQGQ